MNLIFRQTPRTLSLLLGLFILSSACKSSPEPAPDPVPVTTSSDQKTETSTVEPASFDISPLQELFAPQTAMVFSFDAPRLEALSSAFPLTEIFLDPIWGYESQVHALRDVLVYGGSIGVDQSRKVYFGVSLHGQSPFFDAVHYGGLLDKESFSPLLHLRTVIPTESPTELSARLRELCNERSPTGSCQEFLTISIAGGDEQWVLIDQALTLIDRHWTTEINEALLARGHSGLYDSTAWRAFEASEAPFSVYFQFGESFDLLTLLSSLELEPQLLAAPQERHPALYAGASARATALQYFHSPELIEIADAVLSIHHIDQTILLDAIGTLTDRGSALAQKLEVETQIPRAHMDSPALQLEWAFDLRAALQDGGIPTWATDETTSDNPVQARAITIRDHLPASFLAFLASSPLSALAAHQSLFAEESTPKEFSAIQGFRFQIGLPSQDQGTEPLSALSLRIAEDVDPRSYRDFSLAALLPFNTHRDSRDEALEGARQVLTAGGLSFEALFAEEPSPLRTGARGSIDLRHLRGLQRLLDDGADDAIFRAPADLFDVFSVFLPLTAYLPRHSQVASFETTLSDGQALFRGQLGAPHQRLPEPYADPAPYPEFTALPTCRRMVAGWAAEALHSTRNEAADERAAAIAGHADALEAIADHCDTDIEADLIRRHAAQWHELR